MKVRLGLMAMVSVVAIGATLALGGSPAFANQTNQFAIVNGSGTAYYMQSNNDSLSPLYVNRGGGCACGHKFSNINGNHKSILGATKPVYEWKETGTSRCWTYESGTGDLKTETCVAGRTSQLFWQPVDGQADRQFINVYASNTHGKYYCVNASHAINGAPTGPNSTPVNVIRCKSKSDAGGLNQYWYPY